MYVEILICDRKYGSSSDVQCKWTVFCPECECRWGLVGMNTERLESRVRVKIQSHLARVHDIEGVDIELKKEWLS